jgi:hypothetical protein
MGGAQCYCRRPFYMENAVSKDFPARMWSPEGKTDVFHRAEDVPAGWTPYHPNSAPEAVTGAVEVLPMERADIIAALNAGGFEFKKNAPTPALYKQLRARLVEHLTTAGVEFDADADAKTLLGLIPSEA